MYNGMIAPLKPFAIRGAIWYQGETNVGQRPEVPRQDAGPDRRLAESLGLRFPLLLRPDRALRGLQAGSLPPLWEAQAASLKIPGTGMAVITDLVDNIKNIHPSNKFDVGNRLALWALAKDYGKKDLVYSGPLYKSMKVEGSKIRLSFAHVGGGLKSRDGKPLSEFEIAGADGKFVPAEARSTAIRSSSRPRKSPRPPRSGSAGGTRRIPTWSTRRACPPRRSRPTTGRAARANSGIGDLEGVSACGK